MITGLGRGMPGKLDRQGQGGALGGQDVAALPEFEIPRTAIEDSKRHWAEIARKTEDDIRREHL
jgi:hypothetical protein